jgi:hypothetical protein
MSLLPTKPGGDGGGNIPPKPTYNYPLAIVLNKVGIATDVDSTFNGSALYSGTARDPLANTTTPHAEIDYFLVREGTVSYPYEFKVEKKDCLYSYEDVVSPQPGYGPMGRYYFSSDSSDFPCLVEGMYTAKLAVPNDQPMRKDIPTSLTIYMYWMNPGGGPRTPYGQEYTYFENLGGVLYSSPAVCSSGVGRLDVFVKAVAGDIDWRSWLFQNGGWSDWNSIGNPRSGPVTGDPAAVSWGPNRIDLFVRGTDNVLWHNWYDGSWGIPPAARWEPLGGVLYSSPAACSWGPGRLDVFVRGTDNALWHKWFQNGWSGWESQGNPPSGPITGDPAAVSWGSGRIDLFVRGADKALWHKWFENGWSGWQSLGGIFYSDPAGACSSGSGHLDLFVTSLNGSIINYKNYDYPPWMKHGSPQGGATSDPSAAFCSSNRIDLFVRGPANALLHRWSVNNGLGWYPDH